MAKSLEIPAVVGLEAVTKQAKTGDLIIIDGAGGTVVINPDRKTQDKYLSKIEKLAKRIDKFYSKALDEQSKGIIKEIQRMPNTFPEMESDEYDEGYGVCKNDIIKRIKKL